MSPSSTIKAATIPDPPATPTMVSQSTSTIVIEWTDPYNGFDTIIDYKVYWDAGRGDNVFDLLADSTFNTLTYSKSDLTPGVYY